MSLVDSFKSHRGLMEGVNDPAIFKAVFLAGGPGSGKSFVVGKTALKSLGFRLINSDDAFEKGLKKRFLAINEISLLRQSRQTASLRVFNKKRVLIKKETF